MLHIRDDIVATLIGNVEISMGNHHDFSSQ